MNLRSHKLAVLAYLSSFVLNTKALTSEQIQQTIDSAGATIIGYHATLEATAQEFNSLGTLPQQDESEWDDNGEFGVGFYMTGAVGQYTMDSDYWQCVVWANQDYFDSLPKLPVEDIGDISESDLDGFAEANGVTVAQSVRFQPFRATDSSAIDYDDDDVSVWSIVIPPELISDSDSLQLGIACSSDISDLPQVTVDPQEWWNKVDDPSWDDFLAGSDSDDDDC